MFSYHPIHSALFIWSNPKGKDVALLFLISIIVQTLIAAIPALMLNTTNHLGLFVGMFIVLATGVSIRTFASSLMLSVVFNYGAVKKRPAFHEILYLSLCCQLILVFGKATVVIISLIQYSLRIVDRFSMIRFLDLAHGFEVFGIQLPDIIGRADIFTMIFIVFLTLAIRSTADLSRTRAVAAATANWLLIVLIQRGVMKLPMLVWG